ncbi:hypothetical protein EKD16_18735 [Streptomonospora litoralis]|uniref:Uncharacterized protein n=2 Tax=Streptomonospora litoralis TaxID=2498135 RepID=A0A4P6Q5E8_9ACTN|nr:hypothetical protein EKD16_18735 [Streptomonospora litoralis]
MSGRWGDTGPLAPLTWPVERRVLGLVQSWMGGDRLADILPALESDTRIQTLHTAVGGSPFSASGAEYVRRMNGAVLGWERAREHRFDLAIAAHLGEFDEVRAPTMVVPHGVGFSKRIPRRPGYGPPARRPVGGAVAAALVRYGRVVPAVIGLAHERQHAVIAREAPEAAQVCRVVGDPCYDRMIASLPHRRAYRRALGVGEHQRLVVLSSTWGRLGLAGSRSELLSRLPGELPADYVTAAILHPAIWSTHGRRQVAAWLAEARRSGLRLLAPEAAWQAALVAADAVIGDHGAVTYYGAALNRPTLLAAGAPADIVSGSQVAELYRRAQPLGAAATAPGTIERAIDGADPAQGEALAGLLTSAPGRSAELIRRHAYALMDCSEPADPPAAHPLPAPAPVAPDGPATGCRAS